MSTSALLRVVKSLFYLTVVGVPLFYIARTVYPYGLAKSLFFQIVVELLLAAWLLLAYYDRRFRLSWTPLTVGLAGFAVFLLLTTFMGVDPWRSFWSTQERALGVFTMLHVLGFVAVTSSLFRVIRHEPFFYASLGTSLAISLLAFLQLSIPHLLLPSESVQARPGSTFGNPSFLAGYLTFNIFLALYLLLNWIRKRREGEVFSRLAPWFLLVVLAADGLVLFLTETRGDILGIVAGVILLLILFAIEPPRIKGFSERRLYVIILGVLVVLGAFFWITRSNSLWGKVPGLGRFQEISLQGESLVPRLIALEAAWKGFKEKPFLGWGWDNFNIVFNKFYDPRVLQVSYQETRFDKPHNFVLEYLVVGGALLALAYLCVFAAFFLQARRIFDRLLGNVFIAAAGAYIVRNIFIFETLGPLLMWGLFLGVIDALYVSQKKEFSVPSPRSISWGALGLVFLPAVLLLYFINIRSIQASNHQFWGFNYFLHGKPLAAIQSFKRGLEMWSPYGWNLKRDYASVVTEAYFYNPGLIPDKEAREALRAMEEAVQEHPLDAYYHYALVDMYNQVSNIDPETLLPAAERAAATALVLSPRRQEVYFSLAKTKSLQGDNEAALQLLKEALSFDPKVADAHFYYGLVAYALKDHETGYREIQEALSMGRKWKKYHEPRVVGNFFADSGHLDEAISLFETAIAMEPNDLEARTKLGVAYFIKGEKGKAKEQLEIVSKQFDFRTSPSYASMKPILEALGIR